MSKIINPHENDAGLIKSASNPIHRRSFMKYTGAGVALSALFLAGCDDNDDDEIDNSQDTVNLGSDDVGILNYAFALEQLEAAFYTEVIAKKFSGMTALETSVLTDIRDHEIAHREFFRAAIPPSARIIDLTPDFSTINFADRNSVLTTAKTFEDLGVAAYNGAGKLFSNTGAGLQYLTLAGKIVSVEARHAAEIRDLITNGTFAANDVVDAMGFDKALMPTAVLQAASGFIKNQIVATGLPTQ